MSWDRSPARPRVTAKTQEIYATNVQKERCWQLAHRLYNNQLHRFHAVADASQRKKKKKDPAGAASKDDPSSSEVEVDPEAHMKPACPRRRYLLTELSSQEIGRTSGRSLMEHFNVERCDWRLTHPRRVCDITKMMEVPGAAWQRRGAPATPRDAHHVKDPVSMWR